MSDGLARKTHWPPSGLFPLKVVGVRHYRDGVDQVIRDATSQEIIAFCTATLVPEDDNFHDASAVLVRIEGHAVGHLSRDEAAQYRSRTSESGITWQTTCDAVISGGLAVDGKVYDYIVELDVDLASVPGDGLPSYSEVLRRRVVPSLVAGLRQQVVGAWLGPGVLGDMHKHQRLQWWTTPHWDTVNLYVLNRKGIGLGHKLFGLSKAVLADVYGGSLPEARICSVQGRSAMIELTAR